jgi:uncharacterized membrane protein (UPF0182 family)
VIVGDLVRRRLGSVLIAALLLVVFGANRIAVFVTDLWWFEERGYRGVFLTVFMTRIGIGALFTLALALFIGVNLSIARRTRPFIIPTTPQQAQVQRIRDAVDPYLPWIIAAVSILFALTSGAAVGAQWRTFLLFLNGGPVGIVDPLFAKDLGFWLFTFPFWSLIQTWLFTSIVLTILLTAGAHYVLGAIRPETSEKITREARVHLTVLVALAVAVRAWGYWLQRYELNYSPRGTVTGAAFTDVNAELPALLLLIGVSIIAIVILFVSLRRSGFILPGSALVLLIVASIVLQGVYPALVQRIRVDPQELAREREFISRNLEATRRAFDLDEVVRQPFSIRNDLDEQDVRDNEITLRNVRLWDPEVLETTYSELQSLRPYYEFRDVAIDRYFIDGELRQVMLATRELSRLPQQADTWQNRHITFTHGFGIVASQVNTANAEGQPVFISSNIPPVGDEEVVPGEQPGIYFGLTPNPTYSLVRTDADELDFEDPETQQQITTVYAGRGGVAIDSFARRIAFALRFADYNLILTNLLNDESRIIFNRQVSERVQLVAPFLELDSSPYPVVIDGRVKWVIDGYTTSTAYPYSERRPLVLGNRAVPVNYVRNSVKAVVDAFDGDVTLYVVDGEDPIVQAWDRAFPGLLQPFGSAPDEIVQHFRYPQDLFRLQAQLFSTYHIPEADAFYNRADAWDIPIDPAAVANQGGAAALQQASGQQRLQPYYLVMRLPGEETEEFVLIQPYLAANRPNMVSWLAGRSDGDRLNSLFAVRFPSDQLVLGPLQAQARIEQDDEISAYITLRSRDGSNVIRGNMQVLPIADSILYVQPLFLENPQARIPELARVAVVMGERTAFDRTLSGALGQLLNIRVPDSLADDDAGGAAPGDVEDDALVLLERALAAFARADAFLREGNLAGYEREVLAARRLLERAFEASGGSLAPQAPGTQDGPGDAGSDEGGEGTAQTAFRPAGGR